jgi:hypothetical protein
MTGMLAVHTPRRASRGVGRWLAGAVVGLLALFPSDVALAMTVEDVVERFGRCGFQVGEQATIRSIDGTPTTFFRVWTEDQQRGARGLVVYVYADTDAAEDVFRVLSSVDRLEGVDQDPTLDNGPLLERGAGRSVWRENVAVAQIMPLTSPTDLDAVPDGDLVRCLDAPA